MFTTFGWNRVSVLQGGLPAWQHSGFPIETTPPIAPTVTTRPLPLQYQPNGVQTLESMRSNVEIPTFSVIDARSERRFLGLDPEPRAGLRSGNIPNSINIPFLSVLTNDGFLKPTTALKQLFEQHNITPQTPVACTCGSGITACIVALALASIQHPSPISVYDGSWMEWGSQ
jgi:thiosulfate/3-mercaptopyruvate sulfurtransferase